MCTNLARSAVLVFPNMTTRRSAGSNPPRRRSTGRNLGPANLWFRTNACATCVKGTSPPPPFKGWQWDGWKSYTEQQAGNYDEAVKHCRDGSFRSYGRTFECEHAQGDDATWQHFYPYRPPPLPGAPATVRLMATPQSQSPKRRPPSPSPLLRRRVHWRIVYNQRPAWHREPIGLPNVSAGTFGSSTRNHWTVLRSGQELR